MTTRKTLTPPTEPTTARSVSEGAAVIGLAIPTLRRAIRRGEIAHVRVGSRVLLLDTDIQAFLRQHRVPARGAE